MSTLPLVTVATEAGRALLRAPTIPVQPSEIPGLAPLYRDMVESMHAYNGIGIAAPQVGRTERVAIIAHADGDFPIINPSIVKRSILRDQAEEGCLSVPRVYGFVKRPKRITVEYWDADGNKVRRTVSGLLARVFQHEIDHLDGVLFIDRVDRITQGELPPGTHAVRPPRR